MQFRRKKRVFDVSGLATVSDWKSKFDAVISSENTSYAPKWDSVDCLNLYSGAYAIDGLANAYLVTGDTTYLDYAKTYIDSRIATAVVASTIAGTNYSDGYLTWYKDGTEGTRTDKYQYPLDESYAWRYVCKLLSVMAERGEHLSTEPYATFFTDTLAFTETNIWEKWYTRSGTAGIQNIIYLASSDLCAHWATIALFLKDLTSDATIKQQCIDVFRDIAHEGMAVNSGYSFRDLLYSYVDDDTQKPYYLFGYGWTPSPTDIISCVDANSVISLLFECWRLGEFISWVDFEKVAYDIELLAWATSAPYPDKIDGTGTDTGWYSDGICKVGAINPQVQAWAYTHTVGQGWHLYGAGMLNALLLQKKNSLVGTFGSSAVLYYGARYGGHGLANQTVKDRVYAVRFTPDKSGQLRTARFYWKNDNNGGYSGGTGGTYRVSLYSDDGTSDHFPLLGGGVASTTVTINITDPDGDDSQYWLPANFSSPPTLTAGTIYHLVLENIDADPATNYVSINHLNADTLNLGGSSGLSGDEYLSPTISTTEFNMLRTDPGYTTMSAGMVWETRDGYKPVCVVEIDRNADGTSDYSFGCGFINIITEDVGESRGHQERITATTFFRQSMTPQTSMIVQTVSILVTHHTGTDDLIIDLQDSSRTSINSVSVASSEVYTTTDTDGKNATWITKAFPGAVALSASTLYYLELRTSGSSEYGVNSLRDAYQNGGTGFPSYGSAGFQDGNVTISTDSGSTWNLPVFFGGSKDDLVFCFEFTVT